MVIVSSRPIARYLFHLLATTQLQTMSVFTKKLNPITGKDEWEIQDENYDFHQEIARSAFADMLHDTERNQMYYVGVKLAVEKMHKAGRQANVLDIGTGTGLLSMMAAASGADTVVACEAFQPMADCAVKIIRENGFGDMIRVVHKRSTELTVGENGDMRQRANILVTEVFDTELIGEGALGTFSHAHRELLEKDCIVVPSSSTIYAQVVESSLAQQWNKLNPLTLDGTVLVDTPDIVRNCPGAAAVHDIQLSQFSEEHFKTIISPTPVFRFDWSGGSPLPFRDTSVVRCRAARPGVAQVVFMWWDLVMDTDGAVVLSCAPYWAHPLAGANGGANSGATNGSTANKSGTTVVSATTNGNATTNGAATNGSATTNGGATNGATKGSSTTNKSSTTVGSATANGGTNGGANDGSSGADGLPWRDHWMQALYYLPEEVALEGGEEVALVGEHDEYSLWFRLQKGVTPAPAPRPGPVCACGVHASHGRTRVGAMNDAARNAKHLDALRNCATLPDASCLCLGDGTLLGLAAARLGAARVYCVEGNAAVRRVLAAYVEHNRLGDRVTVVDRIGDLKTMPGEKISLVLGEPHFLTTLLPWQNVSFWYLKQALLDSLTPDAAILPSAATVWAMAAEFSDLWKIRAPLRTVEGFSMEPFDELIERSSGLSDHAVEAQPLWEYPCRPLGRPFQVLAFDFEQRTAGGMAEGRSGIEKLSGSGTCHGVVLWVDWKLDANEKNVITTGPLEEPVPGKKVVWDMHTRQGVYFFQGDKQVVAGDNLGYSVQFQKQSGDVVFDFNLDVRSENGK